MNHSGARRGAANIAPVLMLLSFVLMIGFLVWLGATSEGTEPVVMEEENEEETVDPLELGAAEVTGDELRMVPDQFTGRTVKILAPVADAVGPAAFFLNLPQFPFLVKMDSLLVASGATPPRGSVMVVGIVREMNDSTVSAWAEAGAIDEGQRPVVEFSSHYIEAARIRAARPDEMAADTTDAAAQDTAGQ